MKDKVKTFPDPVTEESKLFGASPYFPDGFSDNPLNAIPKSSDPRFANSLNPTPSKFKGKTNSQ